jgi:hypothetical protein
MTRTSRRWAMAWLGAIGVFMTGCLGGRAHSQSPVSSASDDEALLRRRFRGILGGQLRIDAMSDVNRVTLYSETGLAFAAGVFGPKKGLTSSYGGQVAGDRLVVPRTLRYVRFPQGSKFNGSSRFPAFDGEPLVDVTVPVASRISDEALDTARRFGGFLRLKLRIHPDTLLVGWDVEHFPDAQPGRRNQFGVLITGAPVYHAVGGDFREAEIINGVAVRKGWYIDPKTGQTIETDY